MNNERFKFIKLELDSENKTNKKIIDHLNSIKKERGLFHTTYIKLLILNDKEKWDKLSNDQQE